MKTIEWKMNFGFPGVNHSGEIEVEDTATKEEIEEAVKEDAYQYIDLWWEEQ